MKIISIKQPFASLIAYGYKVYEFRTWSTKYRGPILIHASKTVDKLAMEKYGDLNLDFKTGCIIAQANLSNCTEINEEFKKHLKDINVYPYIYNNVIKNNTNKYAFELTDISILEPIYIKGQLGLWNYNIDKK